MGSAIVNGTAGGRLDFRALAERAKSRGSDLSRLFAGLVTWKRFEFITIADQ